MPPRPGPWEAVALEWARAGMLSREAAKRWGISVNAASERLRRARIRSEGGLPKQPSPKVAERLAMLEDRIAVALDAHEARVHDILDMAAQLVAQVAELTKRVGELEVTAAKPAPVKQAPKGNGERPPKPPPAMWVWVVGECRSALGERGVAQALGVEVADVRHWLSGHTPSARHREQLRDLLATLWARESFVDFDEVMDMRERVLAHRTQGADL